MTTKTIDNIDPIENAIGRFGRYQTFILFLLIIGHYPSDFQLTNVVFILPNAEFTCLDDLNQTNQCPCKNPQYDQSQIVSSVTSEFNLICDRKYLASLAQSMLQIGILFGSILYGYVSDRFGRKIALVASDIQQVTFVAISAFAPNLWLFLVCRFFSGAALGGSLTSGYVLIIELSGKSFRSHINGLIRISYLTSYIFIPIIMYFLKHWRYLQLVTSVPWVFVISYFWMLPESPRWLITTGRRQEAIDLLAYIAKKNKMPSNNMERFVDEVKKDLMGEDHKHGSYLDLFKTAQMRIHIAMTALVWLCISNVYYGVNQYIGHLQGNIFLNVMLSAVSLAPALVLCIIVTTYFKRRTTIILSFIIAGISLFIFIFIPKSMTYLTLTFAVIGQMGAFGAFMQLYLFSSEIFPTVVRNSAVGFTSVFARLGGFVAPFVVNIGVEWITILVFSGMSILAAIICFSLPETKNTVLINSMKQKENMKT